MDLGVAGVGKEGAFAVSTPGGGHVAAHGVGGEVEDVAVAAGAEEDGVAGVGFDFAGDEVAGDDALGVAVNGHEVEHFHAGVHLDAAGGDFLVERGVGAEEELLAGLATGVEGPADLGTAEGAIGKHAAVFTGEGNALGDALVDDVDADFGEAVDVGLTGAEVAAFDGVIEETVDAVAVVLVVLGRIDAALGCDGVGAAGAVLEAEAFHLVAEL